MQSFESTQGIIFFNANQLSQTGMKHRNGSQYFQITSIQYNCCTESEQQIEKRTV
jgi:hypothetical protein